MAIPEAEVHVADEDKDVQRNTGKYNEKEKLQDELNQPMTDSIKESTVDYYIQNKDKVSYFKFSQWSSFIGSF